MLAGVVVVALQGTSGPANEVHIPDGVRLRTKTIKHEDGKERVVVDLSELLPVAMEHASTPMKSTSLSTLYCLHSLLTFTQTVMLDSCARG